ncbi:unnamed protein product [Rotaria socialis]|uniref:Uncharacterized protein n=2 Tax=Rotaria socialis TaxID=392032 RepID=A0A817PSA7_9BILA|nr:unnamed protein product [Rotaria socialis]CAF3308297.1 unnamed protein product [Rotaria socialis]CAF3581727.1 unnamed protein product [Rotaria socialis]CAF3739434.1 unnamed protein product [Rotaria socialis]CAF4259025.1 unnamed protein product [Rotaria socialis]
MSVKTFGSYSLSTTRLVLVLICLVEYVQISNGYVFCGYYRANSPWPYLKQCPFICCPLTADTQENTACCNMTIAQSPLTTTITIFGHHWWTFLLFILCFVLAFILLIHINKRLHVFNHWKHFNATINPSAAFTISANDSNSYTIEKDSPKDDTIILEQHPPCYNDATTSNLPPYTSVYPLKKADLK